MRLTLSWRGRDVIDVEIHAWRKHVDEPEQPKLMASGNLQDFSRAEPMAPDTAVCFGFGKRP